jgi:protein SCO1/2
MNANRFNSNNPFHAMNISSQSGAARSTAAAAVGRRQVLGLVLAACALAPATGRAGGHDHHEVEPGLTRSEHAYKMPLLKVTRADGKRMTLAEALDDGRPVVLNFIYTTCNAICPVSSQVFVEFRERIGATRDKINMVSISIDPEQDTPRKLTEYATRFGSAGSWAHYTSSTSDAVEIQRAFGVWRGDKMNHQPVTFIRSAPGKTWVRLDGFVGPTALADEYRKSL